MLEIKAISKQYQEKPLLEGISLRVLPAEILCLLGPSGGGKSTLLRIIAGLEKPESGTVWWNGEDISEKSAHKRNFGLMFQDYALFPHMNVRENVAFGLRMQNIPKNISITRVNEVLEMVHMAPFADRKVTELSGGEMQRIALARAIATKPDLLMLDEPLGALDRTLKDRLLVELISVLRQLKTPVIYVTHDQQEAFSIADTLAVLHDARIIQSGSPEHVYSNPVSLWLAGFLGFNNSICGRIIYGEPLRVKTELGVLEFKNQKGNRYSPDEQVVLVLKPDGADFNPCDQTINYLKGKVVDSIFSGDRYQENIEFSLDYSFTFFSEKKREKGEDTTLRISPESILCYRKSHEKKVIIVKNDYRGLEVWRYHGMILRQTDKGILAEARFNRSDLEFNNILLKEGDLFLEWYPFEKWYNIYEIYDRDGGELKAWYCNITRPVRLQNDHLFYDDLVLDLLVYPDGQQLSLDDEEFHKLEFDEQEKNQAVMALQELKTLFSEKGRLNVWDMV